jgi:hypothetical protein
MSVDLTSAAPDRHYRRWIEGTALSIEANTPNTPTEGVYYVFQEGMVFFSSDDLAEAGEVFDRLRVNHWEELLASLDPQQRLDGARGLVSHDHTHVRALAVLAADGSAGDVKRIARARQRARFTARRAR